MAKATKLPSGRWRCQVFLFRDENGKKVTKSFTADTKKEAERLAALYRYDQDEESKRKLTVKDAIYLYIDSKRNTLSPTTISGYEHAAKSWMLDIMDVEVSEISSIMLQRAVNKESKRLSAKSVKNAWGLVSAALKFVAPDKVYKVTLPAKKHIMKELPEPDDVMRAVKGTDVELPVLLALWLSLRRSEVCGIRYSDINGNMLTIRNSVVLVDRERIEKEQTKTYNSTRVHAIPPIIMDLIEKQRKDVGGEYLISLSGTAIYKRFSRELEKHGVQHISFHDLRHMNASVMVKLHVPDKYAMERGGWSSPEVLRSVYQHTLSDKRKEIDDMINDYFENAYRS